MTAIGVTKRDAMHDWKLRAERPVRASGCPYTIVRPGWFDYNAPGQLKVEMLQGDRRQAGSPADGVIARVQIAEVFVASLMSTKAEGKTFELVAERGPAWSNFDPLFAQLMSGPRDSMDGVGDNDNMPLDQEPTSVKRDLELIANRAAS